MKALFLIFHGFDAFNGISKKIRYQVKALQACGLDVRTCYYEVGTDGHRRWMADEEVIADFGTGTRAKVKNRFSFGAIARYVRREKIQLVYIRSYHNANPFTIGMVGAFKKSGCQVVLEIPTYPYDQEYITMRMRTLLLIDQCFRHALAHKVDGIVTFSNAKTIFGGRTIRISNGIDFDAIPLKKSTNDTSRALHLIGVAEIHYWHGYDRLIAGLARYYQTQPDYKVYFDLVGQLGGEREWQEIMPLIEQNRLEPYVILHGARHGDELDALFEQADFAIGSLARHRSGITHIKTLKNREYAARGIPFIYSETDEDFDQQPYVLKAPADETPIDIKALVTFYNQCLLSPAEIRNTIVDTLSWKKQMQCVINNLSL